MIILPNLCGGGAERLHVNLANDWVIRGFDVEFALLRKEGELIQLLDPTISVIGLNVDRIRNAVIPLAAHLRKSQPKVAVAVDRTLAVAAQAAVAVVVVDPRADHLAAAVALVDKEIPAAQVTVGTGAAAAAPDLQGNLLVRAPNQPEVLASLGQEMALFMQQAVVVVEAPEAAILSDHLAAPA